MREFLIFYLAIGAEGAVVLTVARAYRSRRGKPTNGTPLLVLILAWIAAWPVLCWDVIKERRGGR